jgi:hypothetical protein
MTALPFTLITPTLAVGAPADGWRAVAHAPLLILVGVTGVGKSTLLAQPAVTALGLVTLPDRRELTDRLIIPAMQLQAGEPVAPETDRRRRFAYTRAYRENYPGGMAHALAQLLVPVPSATAKPAHYLFDGLRGENEVTHAATLLPAARFVMLDAPDVLRVQRLLGRNDAFDRAATVPMSNHTGAPQDFASLGLPEATGLFSPDEEHSLLALAATGDVTPEELAAKLAIVVEERRNYDPAATKAALLAHAPERSLMLDSAAHPPAQLAAQLAAWLRPTQPT